LKKLKKTIFATILRDKNNPKMLLKNDDRKTMTDGKIVPKIG
jgi:hypothetical protein